MDSEQKVDVKSAGSVAEAAGFAELESNLRLKEAVAEGALTLPSAEIPSPSGGQACPKDDNDSPAQPGSAAAADSPCAPVAPVPSYAQWSALDPSIDWGSICRRRRLKQSANVLYFSLCSALIFILGLQFNTPAIAPIAAIYALFALLALRYTIRHRDEISCHDELPTWVRKSLRAAVLLIPLPLVIISGGLIYSQNELTQGKALYDDSQFEPAIVHLNKAVSANPWCEQGFYYMARSYNQIDDYANALRSADSALRLNANDQEALSEKAWSLNGLGRYAEALPVATRASKLDPEDGQSFASIAEANRGLGEFPKALIADNEHVRLHNEESSAYNSRASTLESLGRAEEAKADRDYAKTLDERE